MRYAAKLLEPLASMAPRNMAAKIEFISGIRHLLDDIETYELVSVQWSDAGDIFLPFLRRGRSLDS